VNTSPLPAPPPARASKWTSARNAFITGLLLLAPLGVCVFVVNILLERIGNPASKVFFGWFLNTSSTSDIVRFLLTVASVFIVVALITALGYASRYLLGRWLWRRMEALILHVPFFSQVYRTTKQIVDTFHSQQKAVFEKVVLVEFPRAGTYSVGFLSHRVGGEVRARTGEEYVNVFVPTTPNPTSGFLIVCPAKDLIELDMTVGDGMKLIISGGAISPAYSARTISPSLVEPAGEKF
jgi:uncharacterized membrane protein